MAEVVSETFRSDIIRKFFMQRVASQAYGMILGMSCAGPGAGLRDPYEFLPTPVN